jgi:hypothetical protein
MKKKKKSCEGKSPKRCHGLWFHILLSLPLRTELVAGEMRIEMLEFLGYSALLQPWNH